TIPYEGFLMLDNQPLSRDHVLRIELWGDATSTASTELLYAEEQTVTFYDGQFTLAVGEGTQVSAASTSVGNAVRDGDELFLALQIRDATNTFIPFSGRQAIEPVPFSAWTANASNMTVEGTLTVRGALNIPSNSLLAGDIATGAIGAAEIARDAVRADEIAQGAVGTSEVADNSLTANDIAANAIGTSELDMSALFAGGVGQRNSERVVGNTAQTLVQASITVPTAGNLLAIATCSYKCETCSTSTREVDGYIGIGLGSTFNPSAVDGRIWLTMSWQTSNRQPRNAAALHNVLPVSAGTHTVYVRSRVATSGQQAAITCNLSTIFLPG
ncbi:MAG: hypothetical protein AAFU79_37375, partial [Myxococcota bacterium]